MSSFIQQYVLDVQSAENIPEEVAKEVRDMWRENGFGNDYYYTPINAEECEEEYPALVAFMRANGIEECLVHWWW